MNPRTFKELETWFRTYAKGYSSDDGSLHRILAMKLGHSIRVGKECRDIARELAWNGNDVGTAHALGLLHDIGRFEQFTKFGTLIDQISVDHGERGYEVLAQSAALSLFEPAEREHLLNGVRYHNRRFVPDNLSADAVRFVKLIRDADKLDILFVLEDSIRKGEHKKHPEILLNIDLEGPANPELIRQVRLNRNGSYEYVRNLADLNILRITWIYDINYLPTLRRIVDRKLLEGLVETMSCSPTKEIMEIVREASQYITRKIAEAKPDLRCSS